MKRSVISNNQLQIIKTLRAANYPCAMIAKLLGLKADTVKSYCRRHNISPADNTPRKNKSEQAELRICKVCGRPIEGKRKDKKLFCSDQCRTAYQNERKRLQRINPHFEAQISPENQPETSPERTGLPEGSELSWVGQGGIAYAN